MAKQRTNKSRYESRYSEGFVSGPQYIVELICERKAVQDKKELPIRFWKLKEWAAYFRNQIATANKLCKKYREAAIIRALLDPKNGKVYSLRAPFLEKSIIQEHNAILVAEKQAEVSRQERRAYISSEVVGTNKRAERQSRNRLSSLMEIDDGEKEERGH